MTKYRNFYIWVEEDEDGKPFFEITNANGETIHSQPDSENTRLQAERAGREWIDAHPAAR